MYQVPSWHTGCIAPADDGSVLRPVSSGSVLVGRRVGVHALSTRPLRCDCGRDDGNVLWSVPRRHVRRSNGTDDRRVLWRLYRRAGQLLFGRSNVLIATAVPGR